MYKIAFVDLDGTLLTKGKNIASNDLKELIKFAKKGGKIILNSGRWHPSVLNFADKINNLFPNAVPYIGSYNGAALYDVQKKEFLIYNSIEHSMLIEAKKISEKFKIVSLIYSSDGKSIFLNRFPLKFLFDRYLNGKTLKAKKHLENKVEISKIIFVSAFKRKITKALNFINEKYLNKYNICLTHSRIIEINSLNSNKGVIVEKVLKLLKLKKENAISFGDSFNDLDMFKKTAFSVCFNVKKNELLNYCLANSFKNKSFANEFKKYVSQKNFYNKNFFVDCSFINKNNVEEFKEIINYSKEILNKKIILIGNKDFDELNLINNKIGKKADLIIHNGFFINNKVFNFSFEISKIKENELLLFYTNSNKIYYFTKIEKFNFKNFIKDNFFINKILEEINLTNLKIVSAEKFYLKKSDNIWQIDYVGHVWSPKFQRKNLQKFLLKNEITPNDSTGFFTQLINLNFPEEIFNLNMNFIKQLVHLIKK